MKDQEKELNNLKIMLGKLLADKKNDLTTHLRKQPFQHRAEVSTCPAWAIQVFAEFIQDQSLSAPLEEQKVKDGFEVALDQFEKESMSMVKNKINVQNSEAEIVLISLIRQEYLKHTPKQNPPQ